MDKSDLVVHVAILRGASYKSNSHGHSVFVNDFRGFCAMLPIITDILDCTEICLAGAILVDKTTAKISILTTACQTQPIINLVNPALPNPWTPAQMSQVLLVANVNNIVDDPTRRIIALQYADNEYIQSFPLPDDLRELLRAARRNEGPITSHPVFQKYSIPGNYSSALLLGLVSNAAELVLCDRCSKTLLQTVTGTKKCARCLGAWYCSRECQATDYPRHKEACPERRISLTSRHNVKWLAEIQCAHQIQCEPHLQVSVERRLLAYHSSRPN
jgi:hypothetical protein